QGQGQQTHRNPEGEARHRARGRRGGRAAGRQVVGEVGDAIDDAVVQGTRRVRGRARIARRTAAAWLAEGRWPGGRMNDELRADRENWLARWREANIGFHQDTPSPLLVECWNAVGAPEGARVFVPLAGKSVDMPWLADHGHRVFGVELSPLAVEQFFEELDPRFRGVDGLLVTHTPKGALAEAGPITLLCGDVFALEARDLADCTAFFDRA